MELIFNRAFLEHETGFGHPENALRLKHFAELPETRLECDESILRLVHSPAYIELVKERSALCMPLDSDSVLCRESFRVACLAAAAAVLAAKRRAFALVRPPGHHASRSRGAGFCVFNNLAVAVQFLLGMGKRVFIFDFDLHHGNGTQEIFFGVENVQYFSTHQSPLYPGTGLRSEANCINIPLPYGTGDREYTKLLEERLRPALEKFAPDVVAVSAGFDCYYKDRDILGFGAGFNLKRASMVKIREIVSGYDFFCTLEGGYNPESIKEGVEVFAG